MFLQPKKFKFKKASKGRTYKYSFNFKTLQFGTLGLKALETGIITARQIETVRQTITKKLKQNGKIWIRIFPFLPITKKPVEARMGKGKGNFSHWAAKIKTGTILFEFAGTNFNLLINAARAGGSKLPIKTKLLKQN